MNRKASILVISTLLAIVFTAALTFVTVEVPSVVNQFLSNHSAIPHASGTREPELVSEILRLQFGRPIGYACLVVVILLIIIGFVIRRRRLSVVGSIAFFLPTFGYFAGAMFFLAGIGILRVLWMPFWDGSVTFLRLGDIVYVPYMILVYPFALVGLDIRRPLALLTIALGILVFLLGTIGWLFGRFERREVIDFWIYKYSRHPQYLGWLMWTYGVMLLAALTPVPLGGENPGASLPWMTSALIIVCVALAEEIEMAKKGGEAYLKYRGTAPFMLPLPRFVSAVTSAPLGILIKRHLPQDRKEIVYTFAVYWIILLLLSLPFVLVEWPLGSGWFDWPYTPLPRFPLSRLGG